ncbi:MAG: sigma-70 family RNA polymerase sigma factor [Pacificimonas sp.]
MSSQLEAREELSAALGRIAAGDDTDMHGVYLRTQSKLFGIIFRILNDRDEAEDVLQSVYITIWEKADRFDPAKASPITWMARIARNRAIDRLRARRPEEMGSDHGLRTFADPAKTADQILLEGEDAARLHGCIDELDGDNSTAIQAAFWGGKTYRALAEAAEVPLSTMKSRMRRAMMKLKDCLAR